MPAFNLDPYHSFRFTLCLWRCHGKDGVIKRRRAQKSRERPEPDSDHTLGFQVVRVKYAEPGEGKVRLTLYHKHNGKVAESSTSPVTCSTIAVNSNIKQGYHVFGGQEATFHEVALTPDLVLLARFCLSRMMKESGPKEQRNKNVYDEERMVAWATMPLLRKRSADSSRESTHHRVNTGDHVLQLYEPPVPNLDLIPIESHWFPKEWRRYGKATVRLHIFLGKPGEQSLSSSESSEDEEPALSESVYMFLPVERTTVLIEQFTATDAFQLYIDGCRNLPDAVTITRVAGRVLNTKLDKIIGTDLSCVAQLDSDIYNPIYDYRVEYREPNMPPSATLLIKVYTIDKFNKQMTIVGYATLNIFVETGTDNQPLSDAALVQMSLNGGGHQLRLYHRGPTGLEPLTESYGRDKKVREVPCATVLVRLLKTPLDSKGKPLRGDKVPEADWERLGLWQPRPRYTDGVYFSLNCAPSRREVKLFSTLMKRSRITSRDAIRMIASPAELKVLKNDKGIESYLRKILIKMMDSLPKELDLTYVARYSPKYGIMFSLDAATHLPWTNFTHAHFCLNPPGAIYLGQPNAAYDKPVFTQKLDMKSNDKSPVWTDGYHHFKNRSFHRFLTMIIHVQQINVKATKGTYKYGLSEQGWSVLPVFSENYVYTAMFQLPLYQGSPDQHLLRQLSIEGVKEWQTRNLKNGTIKLADRASLVVRLTDGRRGEEIPAGLYKKHPEDLNRDFLPPDTSSEYSISSTGTCLSSFVPQGREVKAFNTYLATKYKSLVYMLYDKQTE